MRKATSAFARTTLEGGQERIQAAHALQIRGPLAVTGMSDSSPSRQKIFTCKPKGKADETACASKIISDLARRAFRRPVTEQDVNPLMVFYTAGAASGSFERGVREAVTAVLASPHFLYRAESANAAGRHAHAERRGIGVASLVLPVEQHAG